MSAVEFRNVSRLYPGMDHPAVDGFDLTVADGELLVLGDRVAVQRAEVHLFDSATTKRLVS